MNIEEFFPKDEVESWRKMVYQFHDKLLLDNTLTDSKALLICCYMSCFKNNSAEVSYYDVRDLFLGFGRQANNFKVNFYNAKKQGLITENENGEAKLLSLTTSGLKLVKDIIGDTLGNRTYVIEAGKVFSGKKLLQEVIKPHIGSILKLCDPYISARTLDFLNVDHKCKVQILTQVVNSKANFQRELSDFKKEYKDIDIEVRIFTKNNLHDRYMISDDTVWSIGSSLKDLGNKDTIVSKLGEELKFALEEVFEKRWQDSTPFSTT